MADGAANTADTSNDDSWTRRAGFTLIELMIVLLVISILAAIAYPSYIGYVVRTKRTAAESCLSELSNYMERYYTTNLNYAKNAAGTKANTLPQLDCRAQTKQDYSYTLASATTTTYRVKATPVGAQSGRDAKCGPLSLDQTGTRDIGKNATGTVAECWK